MTNFVSNFVSSFVPAARSVMKCILLIALTAPLAAGAADPVAPAKPAPAPKPKPKPYQAPVQNDLTAAYEFRTRILGAPNCQRFATEADAAFINDKTDSKARAEALRRIGADAAASGCLAQ